MAAVMNVVAGAVFWLALTAGILGVLVLGSGLAASLSGGEVDAPGFSALAEGVTPDMFIVALATLVVAVPGIMYICFQLRRILTTLAEGDPFVPSNAPRLTRIAAAIALMELARMILVAVFVAMLDLGDGGPELRITVNIAAWMSAAALLVLAQVFREGTRLREEEQMTI